MTQLDFAAVPLTDVLQMIEQQRRRPRSETEGAERAERAEGAAAAEGAEGAEGAEARPASPSPYPAESTAEESGVLLTPARRASEAAASGAEALSPPHGRAMEPWNCWLSSNHVTAKAERPPAREASRLTVQRSAAAVGVAEVVVPASVTPTSLAPPCAVRG